MPLFRRLDLQLRPPLATKPTHHIHRLVDGGLPLVLSQTFRSLIHSRLELGMKGYETATPTPTSCSSSPTA